MHRFKIRVQVECGDYNKEIKFCMDANPGDWVEAFHEAQYAELEKAAKKAIADNATKPAANE